MLFSTCKVRKKTQFAIYNSQLFCTFAQNFKLLHKIMAKELKDLTKRADNYSQWFNDLVVKADLAEQSAVRGCMVIKPYGYAIWEKMQQQLDKMFKETGAQNAYFPLLIPKSFLSREAEHVEGFAKECASLLHPARQDIQRGGTCYEL